MPRYRETDGSSAERRFLLLFFESHELVSSITKIIIKQYCSMQIGLQEVFAITIGSPFNPNSLFPRLVLNEFKISRRLRFYTYTLAEAQRQSALNNAVSEIWRFQRWFTEHEEHQRWSALERLCVTKISNNKNMNKLNFLSERSILPKKGPRIYRAIREALTGAFLRLLSWIGSIHYSSLYKFVNENLNFFTACLIKLIACSS